MLGWFLTRDKATRVFNIDNKKINIAEVYNNAQYIALLRGVPAYARIGEHGRRRMHVHAR